MLGVFVCKYVIRVEFFLVSYHCCDNLDDFVLDIILSYAIYYILPRRYYEFAGNVAAYSLATDWDINQVWAVIKPFLKKYGKAKRADLDKIVGNHVSEKQMRRFLDTLREEGRIVTEGKRNYMYYMLGKGEENGEEKDV